MKKVCKAALLATLAIACCSCNAWPQFFSAADDIATDTAVKIEISREAIPSGSTVKTDVQILPPLAPVPPPSPKGLNGPQG